MYPRSKLLSASAMAVVITAAPLHSQSAQYNKNEYASVTFTKDVLPIFHKSCVQCHQPGTPAPMSLLTYEDAYPSIGMIKLRVQARQMPPWHIDRSVGEYDPDPSLSDEEIATIVAWVDAGAPRGNPEDAPPPPELPPLDAWTFGEPDLIVTSDEFVVAAEGPDVYPRITVETGLTEDRYIKWIQTMPGDPRVVHHLFVNVIQDDPALQDHLTGSEQETVLDLYGIGSGGNA